MTLRRVILTGSFNNTKTLDLGRFCKRTYVLRLDSGTTFYHKKTDYL